MANRIYKNTNILVCLETLTDRNVTFAPSKSASLCRRHMLTLLSWVRVQRDPRWGQSENMLLHNREVTQPRTDPLQAVPDSST